MVKLSVAVAAAFSAFALYAEGAFKIMSYNIRHGDNINWNLDLRRAGRTIDAEKPRFAGLQEVDVRTARVGGGDTCAELEKVTGMYATYAKAIDLQGGAYGNALLSRERPLSVRRIPLPGGEPRVLLMCEFYDCWVGVTHLAVDSENARKQSVEILAKAVSDCAGKPVFLMGDWNAKPDSAPLLGIRRFMKVLSPEDTATYHGDKPDKRRFSNPDYCIDYIAVDNAHAQNCVVREARVVEDRRTSDHAPVVVTVEMASAARPKGSFSLATFNVRCPCDRGDLSWYKRMPRVAEIIRERGFDIVGLQESTSCEAEILDAELPGFARVGCGRGKNRDGEAMYIYYRKSRFECLESDTFWLSQTPDVPGSRYEGAGCPRTCTWALMRDRSTGRVFRYFNTHLDHVSPQARINGVRVLFERGLLPAKARGETVFLTGDLNATLYNKDVPGAYLLAGDPALTELAKENPIALLSTELVDTIALSETPHKGPYWTYQGFSKNPRNCIDYVFATSDVRILSHETVDDMPDGSYASDHFPVAVTAMLGPENGGIELIGENGGPEPIETFPFPDALSACVWRNWGLVPVEVLAEVLGATPAAVNEIAGEMGLSPDPKVLGEWRRKGYITIVRRNWQLMPYSQIMKLIDMTREEFSFSLKEEDFLYTKMGALKPSCPPIVWSEAAAEAGREARRRIARVLEEEGIDPNAAEEPRFKFVKELSVPDPAVSRCRAGKGGGFDFRMISSYFADYGDPLWSEGAESSFPDGLFQRLAAQNVNAVWMHVVLNTLVKDPKYPEFGVGSERRIENLKKLVKRAAGYGIKVYLYMNEPRSVSASFFNVPGRDAIRGVVDDARGICAMCTSVPETRRWLRDSLKSLFSEVKGLGGVFTISMSENLTNCASHRTREGCSRCRDRSVADILAEVNATIAEGVAAGDPSAETIVWNWEWPVDDGKEILSKLPRKNCRVMHVSENGMPVTVGDKTVGVRDYSISVGGPGENAKAFWAYASEYSLPTVAKVQACCSWELAAFPYIPVMDLVAGHVERLGRAGVKGVMLSWSCGSAPAPNLRLFGGETLDEIARDMYGEEAAPFVRKAWTRFSEGFSRYPYEVVVAYKGPQHWGPANPLYRKPTGYQATMVGIPYDGLDFGRWNNKWNGRFPVKPWIERFTEVADGFEEGCRLFADAVTHVTDPARRANALRELDMFRAESMHFRAIVNQSMFILSRNSADTDGMRSYALKELALAKEYLPLVRADSRIGYECTNHYFFIPRDVVEKIVGCRMMIPESQEKAK